MKACVITPAQVAGPLKTWIQPTASNIRTSNKETLLPEEKHDNILSTFLPLFSALLSIYVVRQLRPEI